ncbi:NUDIX domain-containing protein [Paenibacillus periandrae]|uniref:NUDIX domain-containing protein n=1 Tax=Paenibacillus periandrae TaxID=1761741 RepID=UPI001F09C536|nr:NUDIX domain-containing protein [Paenibacillus periandrae]
MVRNTAKAIIEYDNKLLFIKKKLDKVGIYYTLPGGGQESGETIEDTILRECNEELNINAKIKELVCVREYISNNHEYSFLVKQVHAIEFIFHCSFEVEDKITHLQNDVAQIGFEWLDISTIIESLKQVSEINDLKFPQTLKDFLKEYYISRRIEPYSKFRF